VVEEYMTYSADFRTQVIKSVKDKDMSIRQACIFYDISKTTLQRWLKNPSIKQTRDKPPSKIPNEALLKDVAQYPDDYMYERAQRLGCSKSGIEIALKRLGISQKKDLGTSKSVSNKKSDISE
jgi:transposase